MNEDFTLFECCHDSTLIQKYFPLTIINVSLNTQERGIAELLVTIAVPFSPQTFFFASASVFLLLLLRRGDTLEPPARMGRGKIEIKRIENTTNRQVTFCKRRNGLLKKAYELSVLCDADVALIVFSSRGRLYEYATNSVKATIDRYKKACNGTTNTGFASEDNAQYYQQEASKLRQQINNLQSTNRSLMGESLGSMSLRDMKQLETRLEKGINKIRNKKNELLFAEIEYMQKREMELQNDNMYLRNKIAENERAQQQMSMLPSARTTEYEIMPPYDSRNFLQVNAVQPTQHYTHQQRTALQLGTGFLPMDRMEHHARPQETIGSSSGNYSCNDGTPPPPPAPPASSPSPVPPPLISKPNPKPCDANPCPTTFVHADTTSFKQVVQMLTGSAETAAAAAAANPTAPKVPVAPAAKATGPKRPVFKLYERRNSLKNLKSLNPLIPTFLNSSTNSPVGAAGFSPRKQPEILSPSMLDFPSLVLSPVTPLIPDPFNRPPHPSSEAAKWAEDRAIAGKGFYLHPSPRATAETETPRLLPLFPVTSPKVSSDLSLATPQSSS
ncbi:unnamed protein product [Musa hybrid cultivar]